MVLCSEITPSGAQGPLEVLGIDERLAACRGSTLPPHHLSVSCLLIQAELPVCGSRSKIKHKHSCLNTSSVLVSHPTIHTAYSWAPHSGITPGCTGATIWKAGHVQDKHLTHCILSPYQDKLFPHF